MVNLSELVPQELSVSILRGLHRMSKTLSHLSPPLISERSTSSLHNVKLVTCSWERLHSMSVERSGISGSRMRELGVDRYYCNRGHTYSLASSERKGRG